MKRFFVGVDLGQRQDYTAIAVWNRWWRCLANAIR
jgi:hypothetical protein